MDKQIFFIYCTFSELDQPKIKFRVLKTNYRIMKCPNCQTTLLISDKKGVEIDYCPECRGVWLDRGELDKIIERSAEHYSKRENYESDSRRYGYGEHGGDSHGGHHHKKKKSFLDDFFD